MSDTHQTTTNRSTQLRITITNGNTIIIAVTIAVILVEQREQTDKAESDRGDKTYISAQSDLKYFFNSNNKGTNCFSISFRFSCKTDI